MLTILRNIGAFFGRVASLIGWLFIIGITVIVVVAFIALLKWDEASKIARIHDGERAVSVLDISGTIGESVKPDEFRKLLDDQVKSSAVKAIVIRIDSPGGTVGDSEELYRMLKRVSTQKPVVCSLGNVAASGGLYTALGCKKIITNGSTLTGSIGVIMMMPNVSSLMEKYQVDLTVYKSGDLKDAGSPFRKITEEDKTLLQGIVKQSYDQFVRVVAESRALPETEVRKFADGRVILGEEAVRLGLVDEIGDTYRASQLALELAGVKGEPELFYPGKKNEFDKLMERLTHSRLFSFIGATSRQGLRYELIL